MVTGKSEELPKLYRYINPTITKADGIMIAKKFEEVVSGVNYNKKTKSPERDISERYSPTPDTTVRPEDIREQIRNYYGDR